MSRRRDTGSHRTGKLFRGRKPRSRHTAEDSARACAAWVVDRTLATRAPSSAYLASALERCDEHDHGLLRELALGTLRWLRRLDHVIAQASHRPFERIEEGLRTPLRIAAYQLLFLDGVPAHAAVNEGVEQARRATHRGGASFANAVLRKIARNSRLEDWPVEEGDPMKHLAIEYSHPDFLVRRWLERHGEPWTRALLDANNRAKPLQLLAFRDRGGRELLAEQLIDEGCAVEPSRFSHLGLTVRRGNPLHSESFRRGAFYVQDEISQAVAWLPPPRPGESVLDAAAAPGGKSFALLAREPSLRIVAADVAFERLAILRENCRRLGRELPIVAADAGRPGLAGSFDRVVLDLPCTGTGTLRKHPELKWRVRDGEIGRLARQARRLLDALAPRVAAGGLLTAITCSLEHEENEDVIAGFLDRHPEFEPAALDTVLDPPLRPHVIGPGAWRLATAEDHDGFTAHVLERVK